MKVGIVGSGGYIARYLIQALEKSSFVEKIVKLDKIQAADTIYIDLEDIESFDVEILSQLDIVVFTAAISGPDLCAAEYEYCWKINVTGTTEFIKEAVARKCKVLFFSSDAVFGPDRADSFTEESTRTAETPYGKMKKAVEDTFQIEKNFKAVRLSYVVSAKDRFVSYCLNCMNQGKTAEVFHPFYRNCITVHEVVQAVCWLIEHWEEYEPGSLNLAGEELVSRVRIADELNRIFNGRLNYRIINPGESFYKNRPPITQMKSVYSHKYNILEYQQTFTEKFRKELEEENE